MYVEEQMVCLDEQMGEGSKVREGVCVRRMSRCVCLDERMGEGSKVREGVCVYVEW